MPDRRQLLLTLLASPLVAGCVATRNSILPLPRGPDALTPRGEVRIVGYNDMDEMLPQIAAAFARDHPEIRFHFELEGTRTAPPALVAGRSAFAPMGADMEEADIERIRARYGRPPVRIEIAHASLKFNALSSPTAIMVHRDNPLRSIDMAAVRDSFAPLADARALTRWGQLGLAGVWRDRPIHIFGLSAQTAIGALMLRRLGARAFAPGFGAYPQSREVAAAVAGDPLALGFANLSHVAGAVRALAVAGTDGVPVAGDEAGIRSGRYPFDRHLLIYARREADGRVEALAAAFLAFALSDAGQRIIAGGTRGYLPLNRRERARQRAILGAIG